LFKLRVRRRPDEDEGSATPSEFGFRYGGPYFSAASSLPLGTGLMHPRRALAFLAAAAQRPRRFAALVMLIVRTRSERVFLSESVAGDAIRWYFDRRAFRVVRKNWLCRGVLVLPGDRSDYLRGRRRQALRTNLRRAADAGVTCEVIDGRLDALDEALAVMSARREPAEVTEADVDFLRALLARPEVTLVVARDRHGQPLGIAAVLIDDAVCLVEWATASSHDARWALHDHLVAVLIARGVRYLVVAGGGLFGALGFPRNVQHYQHLLGYELLHLGPVPPPSTARKRRRLVVAVFVAALATASLAIPAATESATLSAHYARHSSAAVTTGTARPPSR
jgi:hypothetical protein